MKTKAFRAVVIVAVAMLGAAVQAAEWYVDKDSTSGTHDGGQATPFLTIQEGLDAATKTGDIVHIAQGHYLISNALTFKADSVLLVGDDGNGLGFTDWYENQSYGNNILSWFIGMSVKEHREKAELLNGGPGEVMSLRPNENVGR